MKNKNTDNNIGNGLNKDDTSISIFEVNNIIWIEKWFEEFEKEEGKNPLTFVDC